MAISFQLYEDAALTLPITTPIVFSVAEDGSSGPVSQQVWFGSTLANRKVERDSDPGVDNIIFKFSDLGGFPNPAVTDVEFSINGITWLAPGADLDSGLQEVESGVANAYTFYVRGTVWGGATAGSYIDLRIITDLLRESVVP